MTEGKKGLIYQLRHHQMLQQAITTKSAGREEVEKK